MLVTKNLKYETRGNGQVLDITSDVVRQLASIPLRNGTVTLFVSGSTAGITTIEYESGLINDFSNLWERIAPRDIKYDHDAAWGESNGFSHVRASLLGPSLVVPVIDSVMALGTWQQIVLIDFDHRSRTREIILQFMGE
jgi:secondary thiamine-phosphate synthase enzyme